MAYIRVEYPKIQALTDDGKLAVGWKVYTYVAGTTDTDATTYLNRTLSTPNANPVVLNARGEADIYTNQAIKLVLKTDAGVLVWEQDYVGEMLATFYTGSSSGTTGNIYNVTASPIPSALTANMTVIWTPDIDNTASMGVTGHSVAGPNDCVFAGPYTGSTSSTFRVEIDGTTGTDTFKWRKDSGTWFTGIPITGNDQTLIEGLTVNFAVLSGHTIGDYWTQAVAPAAKMNLNSLGAKVIVKNVGGSLISLEAGDLIAGYPANTVYSSVQDCFILMNTADPVYAALVPSRIRTQTADDYILSVLDHGNEINFVNTTPKQLILPPAADFADRFVYVRNGGTADVTITPDGSEVIRSAQNPITGSAYVLYHSAGTVVQLTTNGVDWELLIEPPTLITTQFFESSDDCYPFPGRRWLVVIVIGGGGGGSSNTGSGLGGAGGGNSVKVINTVGLTVPIVVTIGAGGAGGTGGSDGSNGGTTSFGSHCSATGGSGGTTSPGYPGTGVGGHVNTLGNDGTIGGDGGTPNGMFGDSGYGNGGAVANPSVAGNPGCCFVIEVPYYMGGLLPIILQSINVYNEVF